MAGKRQHHVWQLIQRGFGTKRGKDFHIWVFEKERSPRQTSTRKYGFVDYFLSDGDDVSADNTLTKFENEIQETVQKFKQYPDQREIPSSVVAPIVSHLEMRTLFLREEFSRVAERILLFLKEIFESEQQTAKFLSEYLKKNPNLINAKLDDLSLDGSGRAVAQAIAEQQLPMLIEQKSRSTSQELSMIVGNFLDELPLVVKQAHMKSVISGFTDIERTRVHEQFKFVVRKSSRPIILPDTGLAFLKPNGVTPISQKGDRAAEVLIPLNDDTYLHGFRGSYRNRSDKTVLNILSSCAFQSFITREPSVEIKKLSKNIGKNARLIPDIELKKLLNFENLLRSL